MELAEVKWLRGMVVISNSGDGSFLFEKTTETSAKASNTIALNHNQTAGTVLPCLKI